MTENGKSNKSAALVVGVDGSAGAAEALRWAVAEARLRKVPLQVVQAWTLGYAGVPVEGFAYMGSFSSNPSQGVDPAELQRVAEDVLGKAIGEVAGGVEGVEIERQVIQGGAAEVLLGTVAAGDLLVVGSRGHGGFAGLLLGSVSQQCVHYAPCPVVVVHSPKATAHDHRLAEAGASENAPSA